MTQLIASPTLFINDTKLNFVPNSIKYESGNMLLYMGASVFYEVTLSFSLFLTPNTILILEDYKKKVINFKLIDKDLILICDKAVLMTPLVYDFTQHAVIDLKYRGGIYQ